MSVSCSTPSQACDAGCPLLIMDGTSAMAVSIGVT